VVRQFARVAHATGFMYVFPLLNAPPPTTARSEWQRAVLPGSGSSNSINALSELTSFFPFDPYKLPRSSSYIEPIYREWASVAIEGDDDDDDDDEEGEDEVEGMQDGLARPRRDEADYLDVEADGLGASFGGMSISPVHGPANSAAVNLEIKSAVI
jgi:RNA polymerase I-specific transcription initiation factor RRN3